MELSETTKHKFLDTLQQTVSIRSDLNASLALFDTENLEALNCIHLFTLLSHLNRKFTIDDLAVFRNAYSICAEFIQSVHLKEAPPDSFKFVFEIISKIEEFFSQLDDMPSEYLKENESMVISELQTIHQMTQKFQSLLNTVWKDGVKHSIGTFHEFKNKEGLDKVTEVAIALQNIENVQNSYENIKIEEKDLLNDFLTSSSEILSAVEDNMLILENSPQNESVINEIFRGIHTLKGDSGFLKLSDIQTLSHAFETLLGKCRSKLILIDSEKISLFLSVLETIKKMIKNISLKLKVLTKEIPDAIFENVDIVEPLQQLQTVLSGGAVSHIKTDQTDTDNANQLNKTTEILLTDTIRVPQKKIEDAEEMVGELTIALSLVKQVAISNNNQDKSTAEKLDQMELTIEQLQKNILKMKMFPIGSIFNKLSRTVRDLSQKLNKKIQFETIGSEVEIDKTLIDQIHSPLSHIIRNCIDHGIESSADRLKKGKSEFGTISLKVENIADNVSIEVRDNGAGLNQEKILSKAIEKKIITNNQELTDSQIYNLIFMPGFSTSDEITEISGRGVGMDVVRTTIEQLGGNISLSSTMNIGTTMSIKLPLSSSIIEGLVTCVGRSKFIFPVNKILYTLIPKLNSFQFTIGSEGSYIFFENRTTPIVSLGEYYEISDYIKNPEQAIILVIEYENSYYGIIVDEILHKQKVVSKSFRNRFKEVPGLKSGTIMGDGSVGFIIEPNELIQQYFYQRKNIE
ncbi:MAG: chemotaxis protein CheA [Leptospiraceae bacterium]|nr:chemotaxis protein CheA [Leptospiraceae bacterium]MCK6381045.1 chemotaxis protein CheA [Leptospiraceae bacterium]